MRRNKLAVATLFGALLALPGMAQTPAAPTTTTTTTTAPAKPPPAATTPATSSTTTTTAPAKTTTAVSTPVNLNTATAEQLDALPGIGPARLKKIIAARPFTSVDQLDTKKVIPHSVYLKIKDKVTI